LPWKITAAQDATQDPPIAPRTRRDGPEDPSHSPLPAGATTKAMLEQRQKDIKKDIEKLFDLATQLKTEVEKTDATTVLSLGMVKKAEEIEKLAKQIKDHAKGS
jgi:sugar-specific transcriptional regulator TrmB